MSRGRSSRSTAACSAPRASNAICKGSHPDRLLTAYEREPGAQAGFIAVPYNRAIEKVAEAIQRIQSAHGTGAFAVLSGASLTTEKAYLMGKFARVCLKTPYIDYNGRLCMVSAAAANKKAFGIDRAANSWSDILKAKVVWVSGANIAECAPITTHYVWQAREHGAQIIMVDPRITPAGADLRPVPARETGPRHRPVQRRPAPDDRERLARSRFHPRAHRRLRQGGGARPRMDAAAHGRGHGRRGAFDPPGGRDVGNGADEFPAARPRHRAPQHGVQNCLGAINIVLASGRIGREGCGYATITGQANGQGGREHGQKCDQLPGGRDIDNPEHRAHVAKVWGVDPAELPRSGVDAYEIFRKIDSGEIRGLLSICFNPKVSLPDNHFIERMLNKLDFYVAIDFFLNETAAARGHRIAGFLAGRGRGRRHADRGPGHQDQQGGGGPGGAREDWRIIQDIAHKLGRDRGFTFSGPREIFEELRRASAGGIADYAGITYERLESEYGVFWPCPCEDHPGTPRLFEEGSWNPIAKGKGRFYFPDGKARFVVAPYTPPAEDVDDEYPIILTSGRVVSQFLSGTQTRRIGPLVDQYPEPLIEMHPHLAKKLGIADGDWATVESRRGSCTLRVQVVTTIRPDTIFVPYHWAGARSINQVTIAAQDPISKIPEFKVCAVRVRKAEGPAREEIEISRKAAKNAKEEVERYAGPR